MLIFYDRLVIRQQMYVCPVVLSWLRAMILICFMDRKHYPLPTADEMIGSSRKALEIGSNGVERLNTSYPEKGGPHGQISQKIASQHFASDPLPQAPGVHRGTL